MNPDLGTLAYAALLGLLVLERGVELWLSKRNARRALARGAVEHGQRHFRVMSLMHGLFFAGCILEPWLLHRPFPGVLGWWALAGALLAHGLRYWAIHTLGDRWNVRILVLPDLAPVSGGPYRFIRHPNYVAVAIELCCVPLVHGAWWTSVFFSLANLAMLSVRIRAEERALGPRYARDFAATPRFLPKAPHV